MVTRYIHPYLDRYRAVSEAVVVEKTASRVGAVQDCSDCLSFQLLRLTKYLVARSEHGFVAETIQNGVKPRFPSTHRGYLGVKVPDE